MYIADDHYEAGDQVALGQFAAQANVARLASGGFVAAWEQFHGAAFQFLDANGAPVGPTRTLSETKLQISVAGLPDGGFVMTWIANTSGDVSSIKAQLFNSAGEARTPVIDVDVVTAGNQSQGKVVALADGGFAVTWTDFGTFEEPAIIKARLFNADGQATTDEIIVSPADGFGEFIPRIAATETGFIVAWARSVDNTSSIAAIEAQAFDLAGDRQGALIQEAVTSGIPPFSIAVLGSGSRVLTWTEQVAGVPNVAGRIYGANGTAAGSKFQIAGTSAKSAEYASVAALDDGNFVVAWHNGTLNGSGSQPTLIEARLFDANGAAIGPTFEVATPTGLEKRLPAVMGFGSDDFAIGWTEGRGFDATAQVRTFLSVPGAVQNGTAGDDSLFGTADADKLYGLEGGDILTGGEGDDLLDGGAGRDFLAGGRADDTLRGGDGDDILFGGHVISVTRESGRFGYSWDSNQDGGDDVIDGGSGDDEAFLFYAGRAGGVSLDASDAAARGAITVSGVIKGSITGIERLNFQGGDGDDVVTGGSGFNTLKGGAGNDVLRGGAGRDYIDGGAGDDILDGGTGGASDDDYLDYFAIPGRTAGITVDLTKQGQAQDTGGAGVDTLTGFESVRIGGVGVFADLIIGDGRANNLSITGDGDDRIVGGGGNDSLYIGRFGNGPAARAELLGGSGNDDLSFNAPRTGAGPGAGTVTLDGGDGRDELRVSGTVAATIAAGAGDDRVKVDMFAGIRLITLGGGADTLAITHADQPVSSGWDITVTDFRAGTGGDLLDLSDFLVSTALTGYVSGNPFSGGFLRLVQSGSSAVLQFDNDGGGDDFSTLMTLRGTSAAALDAANLDGFEQLPTIAGTASGETLTAGGGDQRLDGEGGDDRLTGGSGDDLIDGGAGADTAVFGSAWRQSTLTRDAAGVSVRGPDGADILTGVERFEFAEGVYVIDPNSPGAQVQRLYAAVLDRAADQAGLEYWLDRLDEGGMTSSQVAARFLSSPEFQAAGADVAADAAFVDFLYGQVLGRQADAAGRAHWTGRLDAGLARADALLFFSESNEHKAATAAITGQGYFETDDAAQTVALLYDTFLDRKPDIAGLAYWTGQLKTGARTLAQTADLFAASPEFQGRTSGLGDARFTEFLYESTLDRTPLAFERDYWTGELERGLTKNELGLLFAISAEHRFLYSTHITGGIDVM